MSVSPDFSNGDSNYEVASRQKIQAGHLSDLATLITTIATNRLVLELVEGNRNESNLPALSPEAIETDIRNDEARIVTVIQDAILNKQAELRAAQQLGS